MTRFCSIRYTTTTTTTVGLDRMWEIGWDGNLNNGIEKSISATIVVDLGQNGTMHMQIGDCVFVFRLKPTWVDVQCGVRNFNNHRRKVVLDMGSRIHPLPKPKMIEVIASRRASFTHSLSQLPIHIFRKRKSRGAKNEQEVYFGHVFDFAGRSPYVPTVALPISAGVAIHLRSKNFKPWWVRL